jgi:hypothetical protein
VVKMGSVFDPAEPTSPGIGFYCNNFRLSFNACLKTGSYQSRTDFHVVLLARGSGYTLFLTDTETVLSLRGDGPRGQCLDGIVHVKRGKHSETAESFTLRMKLEGAMSDPRVSGLKELPGKLFCITRDLPSIWVTILPKQTLRQARLAQSTLAPGT